MKKVLILTAAYGEGHNAAARGLLAGFHHEGGVTAKILDPMGESLESAYDRSRKTYLAMIDRTPRLWAGFYGLLHRTPLIHLVVAGLGRARNVLTAHLEAEKPDAVVSTYPLYNYLLDRLGPHPFPCFTVVTDSITVNSVWHRCGSSGFFVPNEETADVMRKAGVPSAKLWPLGFPVPPQFALDRPGRTIPGASAPLRILFMINAARETAPALVERMLELDDVELTVTAGRDESLKAKIEAVARRSGRPIEVHGWTDAMASLLMTHHLLIGKAGGAAVQEAIAAKTPMLITHVVPGQEEGNARLLVQNRCGAICESAEQIVGKIGELMADNAREWREWEANISRISRPDAAVQIAKAILAKLA